MFEKSEERTCKILKLAVKYIGSKLYKLELEEHKRVSDLKRLLHGNKALDLIPERQHLIYNGRVLMDDDALSSYDIDERKFILVMKKPYTPNCKGKQEFEDLSEGSNSDINWNRLKNRQSAMFYRHMHNQLDFQQAIRDIHFKPENIGCILARLSRLNKHLASDLRNNLDDFLLLLGLNKAKVEKNILEEFLTPQDKHAVVRLMALGFTSSQAMRAFFHSDRNENKAADLLLKTKVEDVDSQNDS